MGSSVLGFHPLWGKLVPGGHAGGIQTRYARYEIYPKERYLSALEPGGLQDRWVQQSGTLVVEPQGDPQSIALNRRLATGNYILRAQLDDGLYREAEFSITRAFAGTPKIALTAEQSFAPRPGGTLSIGVAFSRGEETISPCNISLWVEDSSGRRVRTLAQEELSVFRLDGKTGRVKGRTDIAGMERMMAAILCPQETIICGLEGILAEERSPRHPPGRADPHPDGVNGAGTEGRGAFRRGAVAERHIPGRNRFQRSFGFFCLWGLSCLNHSAQGGSPFVAQLRLARSGELTLRLFSGDGFWRSFRFSPPVGKNYWRDLIRWRLNTGW